MREIGNIYGCVVTIDDTLKDMGVQETTSINDIIITIQDSKTYYDIINNCKSDGIVNIVTWHENKEYHGMQYSIKLIRSYTINYNSTWNHVLQRRSGGDITITQNNDTGFYVKFIGNSKGIEQYYTSNLSEYVVRQLPTFGEDKQKLETRLFTFIDKIRSEAVPLHFRAIDDEINRLNIAKANCIKMFGLDIAPW